MILIRYKIRSRSNKIRMERKHVPTLPLYCVFVSRAKSKCKKVKCTPCTGTEALYRLCGPQGE